MGKKNNVSYHRNKHTTFKLAQIVVWLDPEMLTSDIFKIADIQGSGYDAIYVLENEHSEVECNENEIYTHEDVSVCKQCGHFHPEVKSWTDVNTTKYISEAEGEDDFWCSQCEGHVQIIPASVFHFDKIIKLGK